MRVAAGEGDFLNLRSCGCRVFADSFECRSRNNQFLARTKKRRNGHPQDLSRSAASDYLLRLYLVQIRDGPDQGVVVEVWITVCPSNRLLHRSHSLWQRAICVFIAVKQNRIGPRRAECRLGTYRLPMARRLEGTKRERRCSKRRSSGRPYSKRLQKAPSGKHGNPVSGNDPRPTMYSSCRVCASLLEIRSEYLLRPSDFLHGLSETGQRGFRVAVQHSSYRFEEERIFEA